MSVLKARKAAVRQRRPCTRLADTPTAGGALGEIGDLRFRALVGEAAWAELPEAVRRRFSKRLAPDDTIIYRAAWSRRNCRQPVACCRSWPAP